MLQYKTQHKIFKASDGVLFPLEFEAIPFEPHRLFIVKNVPIRQERGHHAHHRTKQLLICLKGRIEVFIHDGCQEQTFILKRNESFYMPEMVWGFQKYLTHNAELLVICSTKYDVSDYIDDFKTFETIIDERRNK